VTVALAARDYTTMVSAFFAAVAATAAWFSVLQSRRLQRDAISPYLSGQASQAEGGAPIEFAVQNVGAGAAREVGFCVIIGTEYMRGYAAPNMGGFFRPGDRRTIRTEFRSGGDGVTGVVTCRDVAGNFHVFNLLDGRTMTWKPRRWWQQKPPGSRPEDALSAFFPAIDLDKLTKVGGRARLPPDPQM
jgi:hypothetical protein